MSKKIVRGYYSTELIWKVPDGIDLEDEETYEYFDKWGTLLIRNKKTGQEWKIELHSSHCYDETSQELSVSDDEEEED
jgi:hypothetical protein